MTLTQALGGNVGTCCSDAKGETQEGKTFKGESTEAGRGDGLACSSSEVSVMEMERRGEIILLRLIDQPAMGGISGSSKAV